MTHESGPRHRPRAAPSATRIPRPLRARAVLAVLVALGAGLAACRPLPPASPRPLPFPGSLAAAIDAVVDAPPLHRAQWGIHVVDAATGDVVYARDPERLFIPASNAKLVTAAAALARLGPEYRYRTPLYVARGPADSVAAALLVRGAGDPSMSERFFPGSYAVLDSLADSLAAAGVRHIAGPIVIDGSRFDAERVRASWEVGDLVEPYAPPAGPFGVEDATVRIAVWPGRTPGDPARVETLPLPGLVEIENRVLTGPEGGPASIAFAHRADGTTLVVGGTVPPGEGAVVRTVAVPDAADHAARALRAALERRGIAASGEVLVLRDSAAVWALAGAGAAGPVVPVAAWHSPPLGEIVREMNKESHNWIAEQLARTLGAELAGVGSWSAGLEAARRFLIDDVAVDSTAFLLRDGSGLSVQNLLTPATVTALLAHVRRASWGEAFLASLPISGTDGTLEARLGGVAGRVRAKTGTLTNVNSLSGFAWTAGGRELVFSILTNASGRPGAEVREAIDRIVELLVLGDGTPGAAPGD